MERKLLDRRAFLYGGAALALCPNVRLVAQFGRHTPVESSQTVRAGSAVVQIDFAHGQFSLGQPALVDRIEAAARAVMTYYGRFPVSRVRILVVPVAGESGVLQGTTWGNIGGFPAFLRLRIGEDITAQELSSDWVITHELVHTALADLPDDQHWLEEGIASYVEPIARVQAGQLDAATMWAGMMDGMVNGEPEAGDRGLNHTHSWGRTYWGGAMFCLTADVAIRRATSNSKGLQDALRAIVDADGTINTDWPIAKLLAIADRATQTDVLSKMYAQWGEAPVPIDLPHLWKELGIVSSKHSVTFDDRAPLAATRVAITQGHATAR